MRAGSSPRQPPRAMQSTLSTLSAVSARARGCEIPAGFLFQAIPRSPRQPVLAVLDPRQRGTGKECRSSGGALRLPSLLHSEQGRSGVTLEGVFIALDPIFMFVSNLRCPSHQSQTPMVCVTCFRRPDITSHRLSCVAVYT